MPAAARIGDTFSGTCPTHGSVTGTITEGSSDVIVEGSGQARVGDLCTASCGHTGNIAAGSPNTKINGIAAARVGDPIDGYVTGTIVTGAAKTSIN